MKRCMKILTFVLGSFAGGFAAIIFLSYMSRFSGWPAVPTPADATSIANTYIVFTTFIFVGFTVVLGIAGFVFTQQFTSHREAQERQAISDLQERLQEDGQCAKELLASILDNEEAVAFLENALKEKINQIVDARIEDTQTTAGITQQKLDALQGLRQTTDLSPAEARMRQHHSANGRRSVAPTIRPENWSNSSQHRLTRPGGSNDL